MGDYKKSGDDQRSAFHALVGRALVDANFRQQLMDDRDTTLRSIGIEPTPEMTKALDAAMSSVDELSKQFGDIQAAT
jgi:hypothetical protein